MVVFAVLPGNLFSASPPRPPENHSAPGKIPVPPIPVPRYPTPKKKSSSPQTPINPALKIVHRRTKYYRQIPSSGGIIGGDDGERSVVVGESGVSYQLPGAPFEYQFSYSETPKAKPLAIREPAHLPFAPPTMPRPWTGKPPQKKMKDKKKRRIPLFEPLNPLVEDAAGRMRMDMTRTFPFPGVRMDVRSREEILGKPLSKKEIGALVRTLVSTNRQVNLGRDGLTHNMLELIHTHWRRQEVCKVRCLGVPTVDMDNVCYYLEGKTGGKIIHRVGGVVYLFRGRHYNHKTRPQLPLMLWKPAAPVYPKLIQDAPAGLTQLEADEMRKSGKSLLPICKLAKNGVYTSLVKDVREAFEGSHLVKINCQGMHASDYKRIGAKLMELVPCVLLSFDNEQILMWRGSSWKSMYQESPTLLVRPLNDNNLSSLDSSVGLDENPPDFVDASSVPSDKAMGPTNGRMLLLWKHALDAKKALLLDEIDLEPDTLLDRVEKFSDDSQAQEHSYPAVVLQSGMRALVMRDGLSVKEDGNDSDEEDDLMLEYA